MWRQEERGDGEVYYLPKPDPLRGLNVNERMTFRKKKKLPTRLWVAGKPPPN